MSRALRSGPNGVDDTLSETMKSPFGRFIEDPIARVQPYAILVIALCLIFIGIVLGHLYLNSFEDKTFRAWQLVTSNDHRVSGKKEALEYLNRVDGILCFDNDWCAIPLKRRTRLPGLVLPVSPDGQGSHLSLIDLRNALLVDADFSGAWMRGADLRGADLRGVNFSRTRLHNADLRGARLAGRTIPPGQKQGRTDVLKAIFYHTVLSGADLRGIVPTDQATLAAMFKDACGDERTKLPAAYKLPSCEDQQWFHDFHVNGKLVR